MKLTFFSNFMNHHQMYLSREFARMPGVDYTFVATEPVPGERLSMGYADMNHMEAFILAAYESTENWKEAEKLALDSDVIIFGSAPKSFLKKRLKQGKLSFQYSERLFKQGNMGLKNKIKNYLRVWKHFGRFQKYPLYGLCASGYTAEDVLTYVDFEKRLFRWGYFPEAIEYKDIESLLENKKPRTLLWAGRMLDWKHPEEAVALAKRLKAEGYTFQLDMIGNGEEEKKLRKIIEKEHLSDCVRLLGAMSPQDVRKKMEEAEIFLFTSDQNEGWGAVLNEAMNSGCACVVSDKVGASPFLVKPKENGLLYQNRNLKDLFQNVKRLLEDDEERKQIGIKAYHTIVTEWNARKAAERFLYLTDRILRGESVDISSGPCSRVAKKEGHV